MSAPNNGDGRVTWVVRLVKDFCSKMPAISLLSEARVGTHGGTGDCQCGSISLRQDAVTVEKAYVANALLQPPQLRPVYGMLALGSAASCSIIILACLFRRHPPGPAVQTPLLPSAVRCSPIGSSPGRSIDHYQTPHVILAQNIFSFWHKLSVNF